MQSVVCGGDGFKLPCFTHECQRLGFRTIFLEDSPPKVASTATAAPKPATKKERNAQRPKTREGRILGEYIVSGVAVGMRLDEFIRALSRFGTQRAMTEQLALLARQADAALKTCHGADATTLRMGLLCMQECRELTLLKSKRSTKEQRLRERRIFEGYLGR